MTDTFQLIEEPLLRFGEEQDADDPHDGLSLFGPAESTSSLPDHVAIGTPGGLALWDQWVQELNSPAACEDPSRHRPWPPFPGYDVAFGCRWPEPRKRYALGAASLSDAARKADRYERSFAVSNLYLQPVREQVPRLDARRCPSRC